MQAAGGGKAADATGAEAALVSRGTTVPLSRTNTTCPHRLGTDNVYNFLSKAESNALIRTLAKPLFRRGAVLQCLKLFCARDPHTFNSIIPEQAP